MFVVVTDPLTEFVLLEGQWAPIVGTGLAALGSLYVLLAADLDAVKNKSNLNVSTHHCHCSIQETCLGLSTALSPSVTTASASDMPCSFSCCNNGISSDVLPTTNQPAPAQGPQNERDETGRMGDRLKVAIKKALAVIPDLGTIAHALYDDSRFKLGKVSGYPEVPGEKHKNAALDATRKQYKNCRDANGNVTSMVREQPSRPSSFTSSVASGLGVEGSPRTTGAASFQSSQLSHSPSHILMPATPRKPPACALPVERTSFEPQNLPSCSSIGSTRGRQRQRSDTLEVPSLDYRSPTRHNPSSCSIASIVLSSDLDTSSPAHTPVVSPSTPASPPELLSRPPTAALLPSSLHVRRSTA